MENSEILKRLIAICEKLDSFDWCIGYELTEPDHETLDSAIDMARETLLDIKKAGEDDLG